MADAKISTLPASTNPLAGTEVLPIVQSGSTKQVSVANLTTGRSISVSVLTNTALTSGRITYATTGGQLTDNAGLTYANDRVILSYAGATRLQLANSANSNNVQVTAGVTNSLLNSINGFQWEVQTASSTKLTVDNSSNVTVNLGNLVIGTSGKGIDFSADGQAAGMTSELLDDYEEGTFTPVINSALTNPVYSSQSGRYRKIGSVVHVWAYIKFSSADATTTTTVGFTGLPFVSATVADSWGAIGNAMGISVASSGADILSAVPSNATLVYINVTNATGSTAFTGNNLGTTGGIYFYAAYQTA